MSIAHQFDKGGARNYARLSAPERLRVDFINAMTSEGCNEMDPSRRRYAADAARHLQRTDPARFRRIVAAWAVGDSPYAELVALADEAAGR